MKSGTKIAVITGSAGGLGKEFAEKLLASGDYRVCLSDVNESLGTETCVSFGEKRFCCQYPLINYLVW